MDIVTYPCAENSLLPWHVKCKEKNWISAARWLLSDKGGQFWKDSKTDVFIIDPGREVRFDALLEALQQSGHGWSSSDILTKPRSAESNGIVTLWSYYQHAKQLNFQIIRRRYFSCNPSLQSKVSRRRQSSTSQAQLWYKTVPSLECVSGTYYFRFSRVPEQL